ncbi:MAG: DUF4386 family protein [bacterium]|tara:strand:- start:169 stop:870 length:702 start_codon:yes stop_codon:yes gene_type:complete
MTKPKSNNFGSNCSILSAIAFIIGGISFFNLPEIQMSGIRSGNSDQLSSYFNSVALEPTFLQIQMWSFVFVGILGLAIVISAYKYLKDLEEDIIAWSSILGLIGYGVMCTNFSRIVDQLPKRAKFFVEGDEQFQTAMLGANSINLDPSGLIAFGFVGFWLIIINYFARDKENYPNLLAYIGMVSGVLFFFVAIGNIVDERILVKIAAGLGSLFLGPIWLIWFGLTLRKIDRSD